MSDLFGNHVVGFPTRRLKCKHVVEALKLKIFVVLLRFEARDEKTFFFS